MKIEPGCLAVVINSKYNEDRYVTPMKFIGKLEYWLDTDLWEVEEELDVEFVTEITLNGVMNTSTQLQKTHYISAKQLRRLDNFNEEHDDKFVYEAPILLV